MKKFPKPWFRPSRGIWYVTLNGRQHNLGPDKEQTFERYRQLLAQPALLSRVPDSTDQLSLAIVLDVFLDFVQKHRSAGTYDWYAYRLQRFLNRYPDLTFAELKPYHVQQWVDS